MIGTRERPDIARRDGWRKKRKEREGREERNSSVFSFWLREGKADPSTRAARNEKSEDELEDGRVEKIASRRQGR